LYPQAQQLLAQMTQLKAQFAAPQGCLPLALGVEADLGVAQRQALLAHCRQALPQLLLQVLPGCSGEVRLASEELRCEDELFLPLWEEAFVLALPHASSAEAVTPLQAMALDWVVCPSHPSHQRLLAWLGGGGPALASAHQAGSLALACDMVQAGLGVALLPPALLRPGMGWQALEGAAPSRRVGLCYAANVASQPAVAALLHSLHAWPQAGAV
jgi:DNA-binding transcriptional LysR family regulator